MHVLRALNDSDAFVREHGIELSEKFFRNGVPSPELWPRLNELANDLAITVRYQLAFTLGEVKGRAKIAPLAAIARRDLDSSWTQAAILSSLAEGAGELFANLSADRSVSGSRPGQEFLRQLALLVGAKNNKGEVTQVLGFLATANEPARSFALARALGEGLQRAGSSLAAMGDNVKELLLFAGKTAADNQAAEAARAQAVQLLGMTSFAESGSLLLSLLNQSQPQSVQLAAISTLARFSDDHVGPGLTKRWDSLTPRLRAEAVAALLARPDRAIALLKAIESGAIRSSALDATQIKFLRNHRDKSVRELAVKVLATPASSRQQIIDAFMPALDLRGDPLHGRKNYQ